MTRFPLRANHPVDPTRCLRLVLALVVALGIGARPAATQSPVQPALAAGHGEWTPAVEAARRSVAEVMAASPIPGASVAVSVDGDLVWAEGFGFADLEQRVPVEAHTRFRIASISKALTAAALGLLVEDGRLDLDAPVQRYVPSFPEKEWPITTRQVAGHIAGVRHYRGNEFASTTRYDDVVDALVIFEGDPLLFEPGTRYTYSTYGWNLISAVVQGAAGERFLDYMQARVLTPLEMRETVAEHADSIIPWRARFYQIDEGRARNAPYVDNSNKWAGGGYLSTARDMVRYGAALLDGGFLSPATVELLWTPQRLADGSSTGYGIGWQQAVGDDGRRRVWHTGGAVGGSTVLTLFPDEGVVVSVLTNVQGTRPTAIADAVADHFITHRASR